MKAKKTDVAILALIAVTAGGILSGTVTSTEEKIAQAQEKLRREALSAVMPFLKNGYETIPDIKYNDITYTLYTVTEEGEFKGAALELVAKEGYSGNITFLLGVDSEQKVTGVYILKHGETPGLGAKATDIKWWGQFVGKFKPDFNFKVKKDGGDVDAITASTITSRAITNKIDQGLDAYAQYLSENTPGAAPRGDSKVERGQ